jgi:hypothetical protein
MLALCQSKSHCTAPIIVQISAFLISKDKLLNFEKADFQMPPSDIG